MAYQNNSNFKMQNNSSFKSQNNRRVETEESGKLPVGYLKAGTTNSVEYVTTMAELVAKELAKGKNHISAGKLRSYYDIVEKQSKQVECGFVDIVDAIISVNELIAVATKDIKKENITKVFLDFLKENIKLVKDEITLKYFARHFKAVICFFDENNK